MSEQKTMFTLDASPEKKQGAEGSLPDKESLTTEEKALLAKLSSNERIKELIKNPQLRMKLDEILKAKREVAEGSFQRKENNIRQQGRSDGGGGIRPMEETFLKEFVLESPELKELIQELLNTVD